MEFVMQPSGGKIICESAYAQGKMLDHSGFNLPRNITPSDVDMALDINGFMLFVEVSRDNHQFSGLSVGQRRFYFQLLENAPRRHVIACASHNTPTNRHIKTWEDITQFEACAIDEVGRRATYESSKFRAFIEAFGRDPGEVRRIIISGQNCC